MRARCLLPLLALGLLAGACDSASPVAPSGTILTISASPGKIGLNGSSVITVIGRKPDGNPLNTGTEIRFSVNLGSIESIVKTDVQGSAAATLRADGRTGTATVTATTGDGSVMATVDVQIGESADTKPVLLISVNPDNIPVEGTATVTVIARNPDGSSVPANQEVILTTTLGTLDPPRPQTAGDGTATSVLTAGAQAGTAMITAILGASDPATASLTIRDAATALSIQANPSSIARADSSIDLTAFVTNSQGQPLQGAPVTFQSERGTLTSTGVVFTNTNGVASNKLTIKLNDIPVGVNSFQVTANTPSGTGDLILNSVTIRVTG